MRIRSLAQLCLSALLAFSLLLSPASAIAAAGMQGDVEVMAMSGDMSCCPDRQARHECQKCPLMIVCFAKCMPGLPAGLAGSAQLYKGRAVLRPGSDDPLSGLGYSAPARPPRTFVIPA